MSVNWAAQHANAILDAWYSGEEGGAAIAETLAGVNNPAGRLPVTFYKGVDQLPGLHQLRHDRAHLSLLPWFSALPVWLRPELLEVRYSNLQLSSREVAGRGSVDRTG